MYSISIYFDDEIKQNAQVGEVCGGKLQKPIPIVLDDEYLRMTHHRDIMVGKEADPSNSKLDIAVIYISNNIIKWLQTEEASAEFPILHEVGHFVLGHFNLPNDAVGNSRGLYLRNGRVSPYELAADAFACNEIGADATIKALTKLMNQRQIRDKLLGIDKNEPARFAMMEYQLRIKAIMEQNQKQK